MDYTALSPIVGWLCHYPHPGDLHIQLTEALLANILLFGTLIGREREIFLYGLPARNKKRRVEDVRSQEISVMR